MPLEIVLDHARGIPVYRQITDAIVRALANGRLQAEEQLPTIAELAARLSINPNTVARAYRELEQAGHIIARRGLGTFGAPTPPVATEATRESILRDLYDRAVQEGAKHSISAREIVRYFRKAAEHE